MGEVKLYRTWLSRFSRRVELALKLKGIEYEIVEEDLKNKSEDLLKYNPIYKKVPILVHDGKPVSESLVILEYIDEIWKDNPLLPSDPYERAQARFWAKFIDEKVFLSMRSAFCDPKEDKEKIQELHGQLKILEREINSNKIFGGNKVGYIHLVGLLVGYWAPIYQKALGKEGVVSWESFPGIISWADKIVGLDYMKEILPNSEELLAAYRARITPPN